MTQSVPRDPSFFCTSGELVWGQLHCIVQGCFSKRFDGQPDTSTVEDDTINWSKFKFRVKAAKGEWNVRDLIIRYKPEGPASLAGFIIYHKELADPAEILSECAELGMTSSEDERIIYVNRYDWGTAHELQNDPEDLFYEDLEDETEQTIKNIMSKRIILLDPMAGICMLERFKRNLSGFPRNIAIRDSLKVGPDAVGVHLACPRTEYELGWMVFKEDEVNKKELIAFVYDAAYTGLEGDISVRD